MEFLRDHISNKWRFTHRSLFKDNPLDCPANHYQSLENGEPDLFYKKSYVNLDHPENGKPEK